MMQCVNKRLKEIIIANDECVKREMKRLFFDGRAFYLSEGGFFQFYRHGIPDGFADGFTPFFFNVEPVRTVTIGL